MTEIVLFPQCLNPIWIDETIYKTTNIYYGKYILYMLTFIITTTTNATDKGPHNGIELADFGVYKAWQFSM